MAQWLVPREELTLEQLRAVELSPREHRVIVGAPGSGKTLVLVHRAQYLSELLGTAANGFRIFVYTNVLKEYIRSALDLLRLPETCVCTLDSWCADFHREYIGPVPFDRQTHSPNFQAIRSNVLQFLRPRPLGDHLYDFVLVDEGQDLDVSSFELLTLLAGHVTVALDPKQRIYDCGAEADQIIARLGLRRENACLLDAFRCSPYVMLSASTLVKDPVERERLRSQIRTWHLQRETPLLFRARNRGDEKRQLAEVIRARQTNNERLALLFPRNDILQAYGRWLRGEGFEIEAPSRYGKNSFDFESDVPKLLTYHGSKGLTFDTVLMPCLQPNYFPPASRLSLSSLLFVGVTRATKWFYLSTNQDTVFPELEPLVRLADEGHLTIREGTLMEEETQVIPDSGDDLLRGF